MCVIIIKPAGKKMPSKNELRLAFNRNHDGCGFVSEHDTYRTLDFEDFYKRLSKVRQDENCLIHFRWATHGSVKVSNCHPFYDKATKTYFMHNGVLPFYPKQDITDSEYAFRKYLTTPLKFGSIYTVFFKKVCDKVRGNSRFAFMQDGQIKTFGQFYEHGGCFYSNLHHLHTPFYGVYRGASYSALR